MMDFIGAYSIPIIIFAAAFTILISKKNLFDEFIKGCRDGFSTSIKILPTLIILVCAVKMFTVSGALDVICNCLGTFTDRFGISKELIPVIITRPISSSSATALTNSIYIENGPDSFIGRCCSIIMGSSDTIVYTLAMYFSAVGVTKSKYALPISIVLFLLCVYISIALTKIFFY